MRSLLAGGLLVLIAATTASAATDMTRCADLDLVLAIDASGSIGDAEFALQVRGYADALRSVEVQRAIHSAGEVRIAVVFWADGEMSSDVLPFHHVSTSSGSDSLASAIETAPRRVTGNTGIGGGLWASLDLIETQSCALRRMINVSGDGRETMSPRSRRQITLPLARNRAEAMQVTVNGLAIQTDLPDLAAWYGDNVVVGPDAFVMAVQDMQSFQEAIRQKLVREVSNPFFASGHEMP